MLFSEAQDLCTGARLRRRWQSPDYTTERQKNSNRCDSSRCSVRSGCSRCASPRNRCATLPQVPREPAWMVRALKYLGAAATPSAGNNPRVRSSCCPCAYSSRTCALQAAIAGVPRDNGAGGSSFGHAADCTCRVAVVVAPWAPAVLLSRQGKWQN